MILAKFGQNRTNGSKVMAKMFILSQIYSCFGTVLEPDQLPGSRVPGFLPLPGSGYPVPDKPRYKVENCPKLLFLETLCQGFFCPFET